MTTPNAHRIIILSRQGITARLLYAMKMIGLAQTGHQPEILVDEAQFMQAKGHRVVYGTPKIPGIPMIPATTLLFETGNRHPRPMFARKNDMPVLFSCNDPDADLLFDYPAALFWLLCRYEEYQPFTPDKHGRFHAACSLLHQDDLLLTPIAEVWEHHFANLLKTQYPDFRPTVHHYRFIPTIDVDSAWAYRHKPLYRQAGGILKALLNGLWKEVLQRKWVLLGLRNDPFDTFEHIIKMHQETEHPIWFFLLGSYNANNKNQDPRNRHYRKLIRRMNEYSKTGLHPSYETMDHPGLIRIETGAMTGITGERVIRSRQHFLRFRLPETYRTLVRAGIREEYSMGFADAPGFRAGTCRPFPFYDLEAEQETPLMVYPLSVMDGTLHDYLSLDPESAKQIINSLSVVSKRHGGVMVTLWHNSSFDQNPQWTGWSQVYETLLESCAATHAKPPQASGIIPNNINHHTP
jgi:hypothetical protein